MDNTSSDKTLSDAVKLCVDKEDDIGYEVTIIGKAHDITYKYIRVQDKIYLKEVTYGGKKNG